jgi:hypothetical protein
MPRIKTAVSTYILSFRLNLRKFLVPGRGSAIKEGIVTGSAIYTTIARFRASAITYSFYL